MTRINAHVEVERLTDQHLLAEHREIKRVCARYKTRLDKNDWSGIPKSFTLGKGHELFFINKPEYTLSRYILLHEECERRGFNVSCFISNWDVYRVKDQHLWEKYDKNEGDDKKIIKRISERLAGMKNIRYFRRSINQEEAINLLIK